MAHPEGITARRLRGYRAAFEGVGVTIDDDRVILGPASIAGGMAAIREAWATGMRPTAILAMSDALAIGAMSALREVGRDVPGDVSIVGFDDIDLAVTADPPLTTVHQPVEEKGEEAARLLIAAVERPSAARPDQRCLDTWLVVRGSTGPAPRRGAP